MSQYLPEVVEAGYITELPEPQDCGLSEKAVWITAYRALQNHFSALGGQFPPERVDETAQAVLQLMRFSMDGPANLYERVERIAAKCRSLCGELDQDSDRTKHRAWLVAGHAQLAEEALAMRNQFRTVPDVVHQDATTIVEHALELEEDHATDEYSRLAAADVRRAGVVPMLMFDLVPGAA